MGAVWDWMDEFDCRQQDLLRLLPNTLTFLDKNVTFVLNDGWMQPTDRSKEPYAYVLHNGAGHCLGALLGFLIACAQAWHQKSAAFDFGLYMTEQ